MPQTIHCHHKPGSTTDFLGALSKILGIIYRLFFVSTTLFIALFFKKRGGKNGHDNKKTLFCHFEHAVEKSLHTHLRYFTFVQYDTKVPWCAVLTSKSNSKKPPALSKSQLNRIALLEIVRALFEC